MSELYSVRCEAAADGEVVLRVTTVHPDAGPPPATAAFAVDVLMDLWSLLARGHVSLIGGCDLAEAEALALAADPRWGPRCEELRGLGFGRQWPCSAAEYDALLAALEAGEEAFFRGGPVGGLFGGSGAARSVFVPGDRHAFVAAVAPLVAAHGLDEPEFAESYTDWPEELDRRPRAKLWCRFREPSLVGFLRPGWRWDTASCA